MDIQPVKNGHSSVRACWLCGDVSDNFEKCTKPLAFSGESVTVLTRIYGVVCSDSVDQTENDVVCRNCLKLVAMVDFHSFEVDKYIKALKERSRPGEAIHDIN